MVVAAGNNGRDNSGGTSGYATITAPGNDPYVITVGAMKSMGTPTRSDDLIASYSSKGPTAIDHIVKPDIVAPDNLVVSVNSNSATTLAQQYPQNVVSNKYFTLSGTSMAAAVVSGAVADLLEAQPALTPDQVKARLMKTAYKVFPRYSSVTDSATGITYTDQYDIFTIGDGYLDLQAALASNDVAPATLTAKSPTAVYDSASQSVYLLEDDSVVWGGSAIWGGSTVWGSSVFVDGTSTVWGGSFVGGSSAVCGGSTVWGGSTDPTESLSIAINGEN